MNIIMWVDASLADDPKINWFLLCYGIYSWHGPLRCIVDTNAPLVASRGVCEHFKF